MEPEDPKKPPLASTETRRAPDETELAPAPGECPGEVHTRVEERFTERGVLGRGGMGVVLRVLDQNLQREVAMKVGLSDTSHRAEAFVREARVTAQLEHPNVVPVHELGAYPDGRVYFVMRRVEGMTLQDRLLAPDLEQGVEERLQELLLIMLKVCDAISYAHSKGLLHCDLKPQNIMTGSFGEVYVVDWGIARGKGVPRATAPGRVQLSGTPAYMAPEQLQPGNTGPDELSDVFGLGCILYAILTGGAAPYGGDTVEECIDRARVHQIPDPQALAGGTLPPALCAIALRALARRPEDRYASASELREAIERYLRGGPSAKVRSYPRGTQIVVEGEKGDAAYFLTRGRCQAFRLGPSGEKRILRELGPGDVFGEMSVINAQPRTATVEAVEDVTVHVIGREELSKSLASYPWLERIVNALTERFRELDARSSGG